jgi:hypothetical protein
MWHHSVSFVFAQFSSLCAYLAIRWAKQKDCKTQDKLLRPPKRTSQAITWVTNPTTPELSSFLASPPLARAAGQSSGGAGDGGPFSTRRKLLSGGNYEQAGGVRWRPSSAAVFLVAKGRRRLDYLKKDPPT